MSSFSANLLRAVAVAASLFCAGNAFSQPSGGVVSAGSASIQSSPGGTTITQASGRAILNWQDFSIAPGESVRFVQPDALSATLNRVVSGAPSHLLGDLSANGKVYLINPNGVLVGGRARIDTAGFVASTLDVADADFMRGEALLFRGDSTAAVQNLGTINALGGDVFLIARQVENFGTIHVANGRAGLAAGSEVLLTTGGKERVFVQATSAAGQVVNAGQMAAASAELKAAGGNAYALAIHNTGVVRATGSEVRDGQVWLVAGTKNPGDAKHVNRGAAVNTGTITATNADGTGGFVETSGATVDLSGRVRTGAGGRWLIDPVDVTIDATAASNFATTLTGGDVVVQADNDITWGAGVTLDYNGIGSGGRTLTLQAGNDISFSGIISDGVAGGDLLNVVLNSNADGIETGSITLNSGSSISTNGGSITLGGGAAPLAVPAKGLSYGVWLQGSVDSGAGAISIRGEAMNAVGTNNHGVNITGGTVRSSGAGTIQIVGRGAPSTGNTNYGVAINTDALVRSSGTGSITITGFGGGNTGSSYNDGVAIHWNSVVTSVAGAIAISGTAGVASGNSSHGISFQGSPSKVESTGNASIALTGSGGSSFFFGNASAIGGASDTGAITLTADVMQFDSSSFVVQSAGALRVQPLNAATTIGVGGASGSGTLGLPQAALDTFADGFSSITIGRTNGTGAVTIGTAAFKDPLAITVPVGTGNVTVNGALSTGSATKVGSITLQAANNILLTGTGSVTTQGRTITLNSDRDASGAGGISLASGGGVTSNGGNLVFGGGSDPATTAAFGTSATNYRGIVVNGATVSAGTGSVVMNGTGAADGLDAAVGVDIVNSSVVQTSSGDITLNGTGGSGGTANTFLGISIFNGSQVRTTAGGDITLSGTSSATGTFNAGVNIETNAVVHAQAGGDVSISGTGSSSGTGALNHGVYLRNSGAVLATGAGNLSISGIAGAGSSGLASSTGLNVIGNSTPANFTGTMTLTANTMALADMLIGGGGALLIQPLTAGTDVGVGTGASGTLNLTSAEVDLLGDGFSTVTIGRSDATGAMDIRGVTFKDDVTLRTPAAGGNVTVNGHLQTGSGSQAGSITLQAANNVTVSGTGSITAQGRAVTLNSDRDATGFGAISIASGAAVATNGGDITLRGGFAALNALPDPTVVANQTDFVFNGGLQFTSGRGDGPESHGVSIDGATLNAGGGNIVARGIGAGGKQGISISGGASVTTNGSGAISLYGLGGAVGADNEGVGITGNGTSVTTANGAITIYGLGRGGSSGQGVLVQSTTGNTANVESVNGNIIVRGASQGSSNYNQGVTLTVGGAMRTTGAGDIDIVGRGSGASQDGHGVYLLTDAVVQTTGGGNVALTGYGTSAGTAVNNEGVKVQGNSLVEIQTGTNRTLAITGTGGTGSSYNIGINNLASTVRMGAGVTGTMAITGTGGAGSGTGNWGVLAENNGVYETLGAANIVMTGTGGTGSDNHGIKVTGGMTNRIGSNAMTGQITMTADTIDLQGVGAISVQSNGALLIQPLSTATTIGLGNAAVGTLNLNATELSRLADGFTSVTIGRSNGTGAINVRAVTLADSLFLRTPGAGSSGIAINGTLSVGANGLALLSQGGVTQTAAITAAALQVSGAGNVSLTNSGNSVGTLAADLLGALQFTNGSALTVGTVNGVAGVSTGANAATLRTLAGDLTLAQPVTVTGAADLTLASGGNFINNAGTSALVVGTGRWLVWSTNPANDTRGALEADFKHYNAIYGSTTPGQAEGNGYLYSLAPVITPSLQGTISRTYDGTTGVTLAPENFTFTGAVDGDTVTLNTPTAGTLDNKNAGSGKQVTATGVSIGSTTNDSKPVYGYQLSSSTATGSIGTVTAATLTYAADAASRIYGATNPTFTGTVTGFIAGETLAEATTGAAVFTSAAGTGSNVGGYAINGSGLTASNGNYVFAQAAGNATALTITPATLTYVANAVSRTYGAADPTLGGNVTGFVNGESLATATSGNLVFATGAAGTSGVGVYAVSGGGLVANHGNYVFQQADSNGTALTVMPAPLVVTANDASRAYGVANPTFGATFSGLVNGETNEVVTGLTLTTDATVASPAGRYAITPAGATASNYTITFVPGVLTVGRNTLTITADDVTRLYGAQNPAFTASLSGLLNGDSASVVSGLQFRTTATAASVVGTYAITPFGATAGSYDVVFVPGTLRIAPAALTIAGIDTARLYGAANPPFAVSYTGFVNGDAATSLDGQLTFSTNAAAGSGVGEYAFMPSGLSSANYVIDYVAGRLAVNPAALTITANDATRVFGEANPEFTARFDGFVNGEDGSVLSGLTLSTAATRTSGVGRYAITPSGAAAANYAITFASGTLQVTAPVVVVEGEPAPVPTIEDQPVISPNYAVVVRGDSTVLIPVNGAVGAGTSVAGNLTGLMSDVITIPHGNGDSPIAGAGSVLPPTATGGGEVVAVLGSAPGSGSGGRFSLENGAPDAGLLREASVDMGGFSVVYRESLEDARALGEDSTAFGSSFREFLDAERPQVVIVRGAAGQTRTNNGETAPAGEQL